MENYMETIENLTEAAVDVAGDVVADIPAEDLITDAAQELTTVVPVVAVVDSTAEAVTKQPSVLVSFARVAGKVAVGGAAVYGGIQLGKKAWNWCKDTYTKLKDKTPGGPDHNFATDVIDPADKPADEPKAPAADGNKRKK